ncbi:nuclear intron maturase 4, mitochondrial-like isoform X2 [Tripterygium wilfordii]|nr:nuclear intron maturase 4, mitochondrial-like isoform X2 [Tripterygium wilfordii]
MTLAENLACLLEESSSLDERRPKSRMALKRSFELRIKKRVKEQSRNGIYQGLMERVIATPETLKDAYSCIRLNSNVEKSVNYHNICFDSLAVELSNGSFNVGANTSTISTKGARKEVLVLPNIKLKVVQEAIRIVLEVIYRPYFSKISHGCRSGRGEATALKYIKKEISSSDWWFTMHVYKKMNACILAKLISLMEEKLEDPILYAIIQSMFDAQVLNVEFGGFPKGHGLPQEGILTPILLNIYLDSFDREFYRLSMKYEALEPQFNIPGESHSKLRNWFRRQLKGSNLVFVDKEDTSPKFHCCRFMDEIMFVVSGSKDVTLSFRSEITQYLQNFLQLDVDNEEEILPSAGPQGICFLGIIIKRSLRESPALRAVHKLKEKVQLFASQKQEAWDSGTVRVGKKWLAHGLKKVKESEIRHLADSNSTLSQISCFRKVGMETDHWYKMLLKIWMQDVHVKSEENEEFILSKYVAEPAIPQELRDSFYEFQKCAEEYVSSEAANTLALLPSTTSSSVPVTICEIIAPVNNIKKRLSRYGLTTSAGYPRTAPQLILQDDDQIIHWFLGIVRRWVKWYCEYDNFSEVKLLISDQVRKSCIRTLAAKYRIHEAEIEKKFDVELSRIPSTQEIEQEMEYERSDFDNDEALMYGISYSGLCLLSLARIVSQSRPCNCFVIGCSDPAPNVYTLNVMERQKFPGWKTGFSSCIHPSLNRRRIGLCKQHVKDLYLGHISLQSIDFGAWK